MLESKHPSSGAAPLAGRRAPRRGPLGTGIARRAALHRYVPGAVARQLDCGASPECGEVEATVLFVDIRGFTKRTEDKSAPEVFDFLNRYTALVSRVVEDWGGSCVGFHGDGVMTVFGTPTMLPEKEAAAIGAAIELARRAPSIEGCEIGGGIATGSTFVGGLEAGGHRIWSAVGNTTTTAARLQALTRELDVSILIDAATWSRAPFAAGCFRRHRGVAIRGRAAAEDLYGLPRHLLAEAAVGGCRDGECVSSATGRARASAVH